MSYFLNLLKAFGGAVDTAVPVAVGKRTQIATVACPLLGLAGPFVPPPYGALVPVVQGILCGAAPAFAVAGLVRGK